MAKRFTSVEVADDIMNDSDSDDNDLYGEEEDEDLATRNVDDYENSADGESQESLFDDRVQVDEDVDDGDEEMTEQAHSAPDDDSPDVISASSSDVDLDLDDVSTPQVRGRRGASARRGRGRLGRRPTRGAGRGRGAAAGRTQSRGRVHRRRGQGRGRARPSVPPLVNNWVTATEDPPNTEPFTGNSGLNVDTAGFSPVDFLELFFDDDLINHLVIQTNLYASQFKESNTLKEKSRVHDWTETDAKELKTFLALNLLMGIVKMPTIEHYWSRKIFYRHPAFSAIMLRNRFQLLAKFIHFNDNANMPRNGQPGHDRLYKIRPIVDHLHERFQTVYTPRQAVSVDESLLLWKGRLIFKQYIPLKRARYGIKLYMCAESDGPVKGSGGYCYRLRVYTGKDDPTTDISAVLPDDVTAARLSTSEQIVVFLIRPLLDQGYHVYMDNWYSSLRLYLYLLQRKTLACGTVRVDRGIPADLAVSNPAPGTSSLAVCGDEKIIATKFVSTKNVHMLSTIHGHREVNVPNRMRNGYIKKPLAVTQYNTNMGGIDKQDQLIQPYDCTRKTMKWTKKLFFHFLQTAACNAFILAKKTGFEKSFLVFLEEVVTSWVWQNPSVEQGEVARAVQETTDDEVRLVGRHFCRQIPATDVKKFPTRVCKVCSKRGIKRKESRNYCPDCPSKVALCYPDCFIAYHTQLCYWME